MKYKSAYVKFKVSPERLARIVNNDKVKLYATETFYRYMYDYIPIYTGALANTVDIEPGLIRFKVPYAAKLYYKNQPLHTVVHPELPSSATWEPVVHPKATHRWGEATEAYHLDDIIRDIERFIEVQE